MCAMKLKKKKKEISDLELFTPKQNMNSGETEERMPSNPKGSVCFLSFPNGHGKEK